MLTPPRRSKHRLGRSAVEPQLISGGNNFTLAANHQTPASVLAVAAWLRSQRVFWGSPCSGTVVGDAAAGTTSTRGVTGTLMQRETESQTGLAEASDDMMRRWA